MNLKIKELNKINSKQEERLVQYEIDKSSRPKEKKRSKSSSSSSSSSDSSKHHESGDIKYLREQWKTDMANKEKELKEKYEEKIISLRMELEELYSE